MSTNPGHEATLDHEAALTHEEHAAHEGAGISRFFFGHVPEGVHGGLKEYGLLAIFLGIITLVEFLIIVPKGFQGSGVVIAPLVILSVIKFFCVVAFFMHLKFENELLWQIFVAGLGLGLVVAISLVLLFGVFRPTPRAFSEPRQEPFVHHVEDAHEPVARALPEELPEPADPADLVPAAPVGAINAPPGQALFVGTAACASCHTIQGVAQGVLGPELSNIGSVAGNRIDGYSAEEYIRESIVEPDAYTAGEADGLPQDYQQGLMSATMAGIQLSDEDVDALVEYLLQQK
jgi:heme/copper-type cytochrome/quinol oxidase subunit 4/mono/diheme cytochrome c family protein